MTKRYDCYDNAAIERGHFSFKVDAIDMEQFATRDCVKKRVFEYIEIYYNIKQLHLILGDTSSVSLTVKKMA